MWADTPKWPPPVTVGTNPKKPWACAATPKVKNVTECGRIYSDDVFVFQDGDYAERHYAAEGSVPRLCDACAAAIRIRREREEARFK